METTLQLRSEAERLARAREAFQEYFAQCFWYLDPDLVIDADILPLIAGGLRRYGDRKAFRMAQQICP